MIQVPEGKGRFRRRLSSFKSEREAVRQCFLFSNYMIIATRYANSFSLKETKILFNFCKILKILFISLIRLNSFSFVFLFACRTSGGRLHLISDVGKISLADATLIEEPNDSDREDESMNTNCISFS